MKSKEIRELSDSEIESKLKSTTEELLNLNLRKRVDSTLNPDNSRFKQLRRLIARLQTIYNARHSR